MANVCKVIHLQNLFTWHRDSKSLTCEASTLQANHGQSKLFDRVYDDACDEGFTIRGRVDVTFAVDHIERDAENDIRYWQLIPIKEAIRQIPDIAGLTVKVWNT
jgi:hypothetical protein